MVGFLVSVIVLFSLVIVLVCKKTCSVNYCEIPTFFFFMILPKLRICFPIRSRGGDCSKYFVRGKNRIHHRFLPPFSFYHLTNLITPDVWRNEVRRTWFEFWIIIFLKVILIIYTLYSRLYRFFSFKVSGSLGSSIFISW